MMRRMQTTAAVAWLLAALVSLPQASGPRAADRSPHAAVAFATSHECIACHNGLVSPAGEDVSIGTWWRASMMAHSARDPYWQASVRRETIDHPTRAEAIEDECAICHMPMARAAARAAGRLGTVFALLGDRSVRPASRLAADGVSCTLCHQIAAERLGTPDSFVGRFVLAPGGAAMFGPFESSEGHASIMRSATGASPTAAPHITQSEICGTCHTLYTEALGPDGQVIGRLPEQMTYLEWRHSAFRETRSCQACHMPAVASTPVSAVLGEPRERLARHSFLGGNFLMLGMLNRYRADLGVEALPQELDRTAAATRRQLETETASVAIVRAERAGDLLTADICARNLTGHKLPSGYPARRAWLHVTVHDRNGRVTFESGAVTASGAIVGNDHDDDPTRVEPHYDEIRDPGAVQIYESVMGGADGRATTGLLKAVRFLKDNRLLPAGFDKTAVPADLAVIGDARSDADFREGGDCVRYVVAIASAPGPFTVDVELRFQPIGFRWADNLRAYGAPEARRFVSWFESMAAVSSIVLARDRVEIRGAG